MHRTRVALPVLLGGIIALWGCTPPPQTASADKSLESRVTKLEKELKAAQEQVTSLSAQVRVEQAKTKDVAKERDDLRATLKARTDELGKTSGELVKANGELDAVRKGLKELLGRVDSALAPPGKSAGTDVSVLPPPELK